MAKAAVTTSQTEAPSVTAEQKLEAVRFLCEELASGIGRTVYALRENADNAEIVDLASDALQRLGWLADKASAVAGSSILQWGGMEEWAIHDPDMAALVERITRENVKRRLAERETAT